MTGMTGKYMSRLIVKLETLAASDMGDKEKIRLMLIAVKHSGIRT